MGWWSPNQRYAPSKTVTMPAKFSSRCSSCSCNIQRGEQIVWLKGVGARHATPEACKIAQEARSVERAAKEATAPKIDLASVSKFLTDAQGRGLKNPKLRVLAPDGKTEMRLTITKGGQTPGSIAVVQDGLFIGCVRPNGATTATLSKDENLQKHLLRVAQDPVTAAREYAALMGLCSFCGKPLTDAGSVEVGYGPVCARHWGLPHRPKGTPQLFNVPGGVS